MCFERRGHNLLSDMSLQMLYTLKVAGASFIVALVGVLSGASIMGRALRVIIFVVVSIRVLHRQPLICRKIVCIGGGVERLVVLLRELSKNLGYCVRNALVVWRERTGGKVVVCHREM